MRCLGALLIAAAGCAGSVRPPKSALEVTVATLYPLSKGSAWSYDVDSGEGPPVLATARVVRVEAGIAQVRSGQALLRYEVDATGVRRVGQPGYLLRPPFEPGASWRSGPDTTARVAATAQRVVSAAGSFEDCVRIEERNARSGQRITTTYCPGVGPARVVSEMQVRGRTLRVIASLRGYQISAVP